MRPISLRTKLIYFLSVVLVFGFVSTSYLNYLVSRRSLRSNAMSETLPLISDNIYSEIQRQLMQPIEVSSLMANDTFLTDWVLQGEQDDEKVVRYLSTIRERYGYYSSFYVSEQTGKYYYYDGILKTISKEDAHDVWYFDFKALGKGYNLDVDNDEATAGTLTVFINHRLEGYDGTFLGVTGVGLKMENIGKILAEYQEKYHRLIYMVDSDGLIQVHPDESLIEKVNIQTLDGFKTLRDKILKTTSKTNSYDINQGGDHLFISVRYFPDFEWFLIVQQQEKTALTPVRNALFGNLAVGLGSTILVLVMVIWAVNRFQCDLEILATQDSLTGLNNRRHFLYLGQRELARAKRFKHPISLMLIDADYFKVVNDTYGHAAGDKLLVRMAEAIQDSVREIDTVGRFGGEEFVVLLPSADLDRALQVAERVRKNVAATEVTTPEGKMQCTISVGVVSTADGAEDLDNLLKHADLAMYQAKNAGRNQVCVYGT